MNLPSHAPHSARPRLAPASVAVLVGVLWTMVLPLGVANAATAVSLGTAETFSILAGSTITNKGQTTVNGDIGLHPGTAVTGFGPGADAVTRDGALHVDNGVALQAKNDLDTAYTNAAGQTPVTRIATELGGKTLEAGVYDSASQTFGVTGTLKLDADGNPDAVFIFQMNKTLTTAAASTVQLIGDADPCNVYWQVGSSATLGTNSRFVGTIMADQSITLTTGAVVQGRVLARVAAVTMDNNFVTNAACATPAAGADTGDDDTTGGDDTTGDGTTGGDDTTGDDGSTDQVEQVPSGPVATGGGGVEEATTGSSPRLALVLLLTLLMVAGTAGIIARRRVRV